jgi:hypothetical protein
VVPAFEGVAYELLGVPLSLAFDGVGLQVGDAKGEPEIFDTGQGAVVLDKPSGQAVLYLPGDGVFVLVGLSLVEAIDKFGAFGYPAEEVGAAAAYDFEADGVERVVVWLSGELFGDQVISQVFAVELELFDVVVCEAEIELVVVLKALIGKMFFC